MDEGLCTLGDADLSAMSEYLFPASAGDSPQPVGVQSLSPGGVESERMRLASASRMQDWKRQATLAPLPSACIGKGFPSAGFAAGRQPLQVQNG